MKDVRVLGGVVDWVLDVVEGFGVKEGVAGLVGSRGFVVVDVLVGAVVEEDVDVGGGRLLGM